MKFIDIRNAVTSRIGIQALNVQRNAPTILFVAGVAGVVATAVLTARATLKLDEILGEHEATSAAMDDTLQNKPAYTEESYKRDKMLLMAKTTGQVVRLYLLPFGVGALSIGLLTGSHVVLTRRNMAVTAAYAALEKGFREYRDRVRQELGEEKEQEFRYGYIEREVAVDGENGVEVKVIKTFDPNGISPYAKIFDQLCSPWESNAQSNRVFLQCQQNYFNDRLHARGFVFLNEVYRALGIEETRAGQVMGWSIGEGNDNFVSFGLFNRNDDWKVRDFVNGREKSILLDFNIDRLPIISRLREDEAAVHSGEEK